MAASCPSWAPHARIQFVEFGGKNPVVDDQLAEVDERAHHLHTHGRGGIAVEDVGGLDGAVLRESVGAKTRITVLL